MVGPCRSVVGAAMLLACVGAVSSESRWPIPRAKRDVRNTSPLKHTSPNLLERHRWKPQHQKHNKTFIDENGSFSKIGRSLKQLEDEFGFTEEIRQDEAREDSLVVFRVIGCSLVTALVGLTLILYVSSGMFYHDCLAQICSEACLLTAYTFILLTTTDSFRIEKGLCLGVALLLHFLFLGTFFFSLIEVVCMCRLLIVCFPKTLLSSSRSIMLWGWTLPAVISGVSAIIWHDQYTTKRNCWVDLSRSPAWPTLIPIGSCVGLQVILLLMLLLVSEVPASVPRQHYRRARSHLTTRWASAVLLVLQVVAWGCGVMAHHKARESYYAAFTMASILLAVCTFILRISTDEEIRKIITANALCFIVPASNSISPFAQKALPQLKSSDFGTSRDVITNHN